MNLTQPLHSAAYVAPRATAMILANGKRSWSALYERVSRLAGGLRRLGVCAGMPVGILSTNSAEYLEYYLAVWWSGAVVLPLNSRWTAAENAYAIRDSGAEVLLVSREFLPQIGEIRAAATTLMALIYLGEDETPDGLVSYEALATKSEPVADAERKDEDLAGIYYTGGTTGLPKGVMLSHRALWTTSLMFSKEFCMDSATRYLHAAPMFHLADGAGGLATTMVGGAHAFCRTFSPSEFIRCVDQHKITHSILVPAMLGMVLDHESFHAEKLGSLQTLIYGASPMPAGILRKALERLPNVGFVQIYGQTELGALISVLSPGDHYLESTKLRSAGRAASGVQIRIVDDCGVDVPRGSVGEVIASSPGIMSGYWKKPEETAATLTHGWVHTGDGAYLDEDGFLNIADRLKDMIVTGGENVFSVEVENALSTHPGVAQVAVFGVPSEDWGEAVHAMVVPRPGYEVSEKALSEHCSALIANYKRPKSFTIRDEPLPLSGAGKILKRELRKPFWAGRERAVN